MHNVCHVNQGIETDDFLLSAERSSEVGEFRVFNQKRVKFLPAKIGERFPNLEAIQVENTGLGVVRRFYFKNMQKVVNVRLGFNQIATINPGAFDDFVSVEEFDLEGNQLTTLDKDLFVHMVSLHYLYLENNNIKLLNPKTFEISGGQLYGVSLTRNYCVSKYFRKQELVSMEIVLAANCSQNI